MMWPNIQSSVPFNNDQDKFAVERSAMEDKVLYVVILLCFPVKTYSIAMLLRRAVMASYRVWCGVIIIVVVILTF